MNIKEYQEIIGKTAVYPQQVDNFGLAYCVFGIFDEMSEVHDKVDKNDTQANINKEIGDVLWYICAMCHELGLDFEEIVTKRTNLPDVDPFYVFGVVKKFYRDKKPIDPDKIKEYLKDLTYGLLAHLPEETILGILEENYNKLIRRRETNTLHGDGDNREQS
jgi:NTP pyrophosphatase (non-canonical NTP hydrolase)